MFLELGTTNVHHKTNKMTTLGVLPWQQFCCWCFLIKNWNSQFLSETKNHETMWELVCSKQDPLAHFRGYKWGYLFFFFWHREFGAERVAMATLQGCYFVLLWCTFVVPSFKNTASVFPEIFFIRYFNIF